MPDSSCDLYTCPACLTVVFIPTDAGVTGGVCTQQARGCRGEIAKVDDATAATLRRVFKSRGYVEQPWLTIVPKGGA